MHQITDAGVLGRSAAATEPLFVHVLCAIASPDVEVPRLLPLPPLLSSPLRPSWRKALPLCH